MDVEKYSKVILIFAIIAFLITTVYVSVGVSRIAWFDEAFSIETTHKMDNEGIDFKQYDVHPPAYYHMLDGWMKMQPSFLPETDWARLLSVVFGVVFLCFVYLIVRELGYSKFVSATATLFMSLSTTFIHYFTEIRMYGALLAVCAVGIYFLIQYLNGYWSYGNVIGMMATAALAPFLHYFGFMLGAFMIAAILMTFTKLDWRFEFKTVFSFIVTYGIALYFAFDFAFSQRARIVQMFFEQTSIFTFPSALLFPFHYPEWTQMGSIAQNYIISIMQLWVVFIFLLMTAWFIKDYFINNKVARREDKLFIMMFSCSLIPLLAIVASHYVLDLYHHRFVLCMLWMFGLVVTIILARSIELLMKKWSEYSTVKRWISAIAIIFTVMFFFVQAAVGQSVYISETPRFQEEMYALIPCGSDVTVVHMTSFTIIPELVDAREHGCMRNRVLVTDFPEEVGHSGGFDAINPALIYRINETRAYELKNNSYVIDGGFFVLNSEGGNPVIAGEGKEFIGHWEEHQGAMWDIYKLDGGEILLGERNE